MKYQSEICKINNCPPNDCILEQQTAYRFVFDPVCKKSFLPQGIKMPSRIDNSNNQMKCSLLALSFFSTEENAREKYKKLKRKIKNINKTLGSHIAEGILNTTDGQRTKICQKSGHFDFFENNDVDLVPNFKIVFDLRTGA